MSGGGGRDMAGREASEAEAASGLGFVDVDAFRRWRGLRDETREFRLDWMLTELCNLRSEVEALKEELKRRKPETEQTDAGTIH